jgi:hypothetical protein
MQSLASPADTTDVNKGATTDPGTQHVNSSTATLQIMQVRAIFITSLLRLALRKFVILMGIRESWRV